MTPGRMGGAMSELTAKRQYRNPPIEEAVVEFRFDSGGEWDPTLPGKLHSHPNLQGRYPGRPRAQRTLEASLKAGADQPPNVSFKEGIVRVQLLDESAKRMVTLGPDVLGVNDLRPYTGWSAFRPRVQAALSAYAEIASPKLVVRIGVRYVNKILVSREPLNLEDYFLCGPRTILGLPSTLNAFTVRTQHVFDDGVKLLLTFANLEEPSVRAPQFLLDLDVSWEGSEPVAVDEAMARVDDLHEREGTAFEATITDAMREVFDGIPG
jgi:uncharacterized protein (TIGR04255 family)